MQNVGSKDTHTHKNIQKLKRIPGHQKSDTLASFLKKLEKYKKWVFEFWIQ